MRMFKSKLAYIRQNLVHAFKRDEGTVTVEFAIMAPLLAGFYVAMFVWFDAYRQKTLIMKASYAISDVFSRQVQVDEAFMDNMVDMMDYMIPSHAKPRMRVSLIEYNTGEAGSTPYRLRWSYGPHGMTDLTQLDLDADTSWLPIMSHLDAVVVVETAVLYQPIFRVGIDPKVHRNTFVTRPRFHVTLHKSDEPTYASNFPDIDDYGDGDPTAGATPTN
ncbi:MAG: pilus assembly protein [Pseudomonadota bacterium]